MTAVGYTSTASSGAGDASAANQVLEIAELASIDSKTPPLGQAAMAASVPVTMASDQTMTGTTNPVALTGTDQTIAATATDYRGFTIRETAGATALVTLYDHASLATGTILETISLAPGESRSEYYGDGGIKATNGIFAKINSGAVVGSVRTG